MNSEEAALRAHAVELRRLAKGHDDPRIRAELLELAARCERLANEMGGNGRATHN